MKRANKKRNSALIFEFLIRHISKCLIEGKKADAKKAMDISKKYFSKGTPLQSELALFNSILKTQVKSKESAHRIINEVCKVASRMNVRNLDEQKSKLIKDINYTLKEKDFYDVKIPHYTVYSSVQSLLNESRNKKKILEIVDRIKIEENIADYLTRESTAASGELKVNPNYSNTVYKLLTQKFYKKYEGKLNESQKKLLIQYSAYLISNKPDLIQESVSREMQKIKTSLSNIRDESIKKDGDLMKKIQECKKKLESFSASTLSENNILEVLQYMKLVEELES